MMKSKMVGLLALLAATLFAGSAFAANRVEVKVTSEPIQQGATCEKAGGYTMEFDAGTVINAGDQITVDLPLNVTLCNDIDIMIPYAGVNTAAAYGTPVVGSAVVAGGAADTAQFYISGDAGTQRVNIDVKFVAAAAPAVEIAAGTLTVTDADADPATADTFTIEFFDQNIVGVFVYDVADADGLYDDNAAIADNTRCINISAYANETVNDSLDSAADKYTFIPSNPQVAHVIAATGFSLYECTKQTVGRVVVGTKTSSQTGGSESCDAFDFEAATGYCADTHSDNNKLIIASTADMVQTDYMLEMEILTTGVYWSNQAVGYENFDTTALACADAGAASSVAPTTYANALGVTAGIVPAAPLADECDVELTEQAVKLTVASFAPIDANDRALWIDMPAFNYDLDEITSGDEIEVKVKLSKVPCGQVIEATIVVGTFGCIPATTFTDISFPYFTEITGDSFWDGFALINKTGNAGTADLTIYEADGDVFTASIDVAARSMAVHNTADLLAISTKQSGAGTQGDARFYMTVRADFNIDGFAMMADPSTGESMGYLPRLESN